MNELQAFVFSKEQFRRARLPSLYSDFQIQQSINPDGYAANITAWESALAQAAFAGKIAGGQDRLSLKIGQDLLQDLETKEWGRPMALGAVIYEAVSRGQMMPSRTYLGATASILDRSWKTTSWNVITWGWRQLSLVGAASEHHPLRDCQIVLLENLQLASQKVKNALSSRVDRVERVLPMETFESEASFALGLDARLSPFDLKILLMYMSRDTRQISYNQRVVKLRDPQDSATILSATDESIASLQLLIANMTAQQSMMASRIAELSANARAAVSAKNNSSAMSALRSKKNHESLYKARSDRLTQLEEVYLKLVEAVDQVEVVRVMQESTTVLRDIHKGIGSVEAVEDVVQGLREELNKVEDINNVISESTNANIDEEEIDGELQKLETKQKEEDERKRARERQKELESLPPVPRLQEPAESRSAKETPEEPMVVSAADAFRRLSVQEDQEDRAHEPTHEKNDIAEVAGAEPA